MLEIFISDRKLSLFSDIQTGLTLPKWPPIGLKFCMAVSRSVIFKIRFVLERSEILRYIVILRSSHTVFKNFPLYTINILYHLENLMSRGPNFPNLCFYCSENLFNGPVRMFWSTILSIVFKKKSVNLIGLKTLAISYSKPCFGIKTTFTFRDGAKSQTSNEDSLQRSNQDFDSIFGLPTVFYPQR
jgi:hypothetical protein